jgi:hypothetical protein
MVSQLKSDTARINGAKSRGPTTDEGKEKSSRNSLKHGLTATSGKLLLDCEDPHQFDEILNKFHTIHEPATEAEKDIVEEMVAARWRIRRMWTIETGLLNAEILTQQSNPGDPDIHLASAFRILADDSRSLALANRYEARLQRTYDRAYKTLRELQQARKSEPPEQPQNFQIKWVSPTAPSVSEGDESESTPPNPPPNQNCETAEPTEPRASASGGPSPKLPNEPTAAAIKEVSNPVAQAFVPVFRNSETPVDPDLKQPVKSPCL